MNALSKVFLDTNVTRGSNFVEWICSHCDKRDSQQPVHDRLSVIASSDRTDEAHRRPSKRRKIGEPSGLSSVRTDRRAQFDTRFDPDSPSKLSMKASEASTLDCITIRRPGDKNQIVLSKSSLPHNCPKEEEKTRVTRWLKQTTEGVNDPHLLQLIGLRTRDGPASLIVSEAQRTIDDQLPTQCHTEHAAAAPVGLYEISDPVPQAPLVTESGPDTISSSQQRLEARQPTEPGTQGSALSPPYTPPHCPDEQDQPMELLDPLFETYHAIIVKTNNANRTISDKELTTSTFVQHDRLSGLDKATQYNGVLDLTESDGESKYQRLPVVSSKRDLATQTTSLLPPGALQDSKISGLQAFEEIHYQVPAAIFESLKSEREQLLQAVSERDDALKEIANRIKEKQFEDENVVAELKELRERVQVQEREIRRLRSIGAEIALTPVKSKSCDQKISRFGFPASEQRSCPSDSTRGFSIIDQQLVNTARAPESVRKQSHLELGTIEEDFDDLDALLEGFQNEAILRVDSDELDRVQVESVPPEQQAPSAEPSVTFGAGHGNIYEEHSAFLDALQSGIEAPVERNLFAGSISGKLRKGMTRLKNDEDESFIGGLLLNEDLEAPTVQDMGIEIEDSLAQISHLKELDSQKEAPQPNQHDGDLKISEASFWGTEAETRATLSKDLRKGTSLVSELEQCEHNVPDSQQILSIEDAISLTHQPISLQIEPTVVHDNLVDKLYDSASRAEERSGWRPEVFQPHEKPSVIPSQGQPTECELYKPMSDGTLSEIDKDRTISDLDETGEGPDVRTDPLAERLENCSNLVHCVDGNKGKVQTPEAQVSYAHSIDNDFKPPDSEDEIALVKQAPVAIQSPGWKSKIRRNYKYSSLPEAKIDWALRSTEWALQCIDVDAKIAEIAQRPSRKATFGNVIANVRKERGIYPHRSGNFHAEKPLPAPKRKQKVASKRAAPIDLSTYHSGDTTEEEDDHNSDQSSLASNENDENTPPPDDDNALEEEDEDPLVKFDRMMGVPENAIPCLVDNQLAYKDGTRVRNIHTLTRFHFHLILLTAYLGYPWPSPTHEDCIQSRSQRCGPASVKMQVRLCGYWRFRVRYLSSSHIGAWIWHGVWFFVRSIGSELSDKRKKERKI